MFLRPGYQALSTQASQEATWTRPQPFLQAFRNQPPSCCHRIHALHLAGTQLLLDEPAYLHNPIGTAALQGVLLNQQLITDADPPASPRLDPSARHESTANTVGRKLRYALRTSAQMCRIPAGTQSAHGHRKISTSFHCRGKKIIPVLKTGTPAGGAPNGPTTLFSPTQGFRLGLLSAGSFNLAQGRLSGPLSHPGPPASNVCGGGWPSL